MQKLIIGTGIIIVLVGIVWFARPASQVTGTGAQNTKSQVNDSSVLTAEETSFDFGAISMAKGNVTHLFAIKNPGADPATISKIYTSCMCTTASLMINGKTSAGPFGMPGHAAIPRIN